MNANSPQESFRYEHRTCSSRRPKALGYTEVETRFLYIVATHSGYFTARQFLAFAGAHWGKRTTTFWSKLETKRHARMECFPKSGVVYHLFARRLYRQIEKENLRNRREHEFEFIKRRIAILDFVLLNQGVSVPSKPSPKKCASSVVL